MGDHINADGRFQSDKYPTCPAGKVPLSTRDRTAQDLLWDYAQRRRPIDFEFSEDLQICLKNDGYNPDDSRTRAARITVKLAGYLASAGWQAVEDDFWNDPHPELVNCAKSFQSLHRAVERQMARDLKQPDPFYRQP